MSLTVTSRGFNSSITAGTTYVFSPLTNWGTNVDNNNSAWLIFCYDPGGVAGSDTFSSLADSHGNTWTLIDSAANILGAGSGVIYRCYFSKMDVATLTTASVITITFSSSVTAKAHNLIEINTNLSGYQVGEFSGASTSTTGTSATPTITTGSIGVDDVVIGALCAEGNDTRTGDSDTVNGTWTALISTGNGVGTAGIQLLTQYKIQTTTSSTQTYNPTLSLSENYAIAWIQAYEYKNLTDPYGTLGYYGV